MGRRTEKVFLLGLTLVASVLLLSNLGNHYLWNDEAQTALIGKAILRHGVPMGRDEINSYSGAFGAELGADGMMKWQPPLQFYVVAGSFQLFGTTTWAARLPFALAGIGCVLLVYYLGRELFGTRAGMVASALLAPCVSFLLLARQCRYFSLVTLFALAAVHQYALLPRNRRNTPLLLILFLVLLFYSQTIYYGIVVATIVAHAVLCRREALRRTAVAVAGTVVLVVPWLMYGSLAKYRAMYPGLFTWGQLVTFGGIYLSRLVDLFNDWLLLLIAVAVGLVHKYGVRRARVAIPDGLVLLVIFGGVTLVVVSLASAGPFFRYLTPLIPAAALVAAVALEPLYAMSRVAGTAAVVLLGTGGDMRSYVYELTHDYDGPIEGIVKYLQKNASDRDTVVITYGDLSLKFYTGLRILGGLTGEDLSDAGSARFIILRNHYVCWGDMAVRDYVLAHVDLSRYEATTLDYPDVTFENREDPREHLFWTASNVPGVVIRERR
jgi:4-amino-4-deoxy-L-arabinose transferase-like glycosyltransferase